MDHLNRRITGIHQPNYLPWPGYFYKISRCDDFVFLNHVSINKSGFTRRTLIPDPNNTAETTYLSVPLRKFSDSASIDSLLVDHSRPWQIEHLNKISACYRKFPFFGEYFPFFEKILKDSTHTEKLSDLNISLVVQVCTLLGISANWHRSSEMQLNSANNEMNAGIVRLLGGTTYLSGEGAGRTYQDEDVFKMQGIELVYSDYLQQLSYRPYCDDAHAMKCSVLDIVFRLGVPGVREYFGMSGK